MDFRCFTSPSEGIRTDVKVSGVLGSKAPGTGPDWAPGSWGGHRVMCGKYDGTVRTIRTWGVDVAVHPEFWAAYVVAVDATISHEWLTTTGLTPLGLDFDALRADMAYIQPATS